ncbi:MAG: protein kinase [Holophagales bacterium]|nr:protein kinase [Holophagales bacterium]
MADVFLAVRDDDEFHQKAAVKLARLRLDSEDELQRFRQERQILANLDHENIARLLDGGTTDEGRPFLVMEYVQGSPLDHYCDEIQASVEERLALIESVCSAVQVAHQNLIVHRDLKPANILVASSGQPKLLDFGIAKFLDPTRSPITVAATRTGLNAMTPEYASPEQIRGEPLTTATDVYSLGVLLYMLLTGEWPYHVRNRSFAEISRAICDQEPLRPSQRILRSTEPCRIEGKGLGSRRKLSHRLRGDLDSIVLCALHKDPKKRYGSAEQLAEDIRRELAGFPIRARKDTIGYRAFKFVRRHRIGSSVAAVLLFLVVGFAFQSFQIRDARKRIEKESQRAQELLVKQYRLGARSTLEKHKWLEAAHLFAKAAAEGKNKESVESAILSVQSLIGNIDLIKILPHRSRVAGFEVIASPDQSLIVTASGDQAQIWRTSTGKKIAGLGHDGLRAVQFSPSGRYLLTIGLESVYLYDTRAGLSSWIREVRKSIYSASCAPRFIDQEQLLSTCHKDRVSFTALKPRVRSRVSVGHAGLIGFDIDQGGDHLVTYGDRGGAVRLWDLDGVLAGPTIRHEGEDVRALFDPSGRYVITESIAKGTVRVWKTLDGTPASPLISLQEEDWLIEVRYSFFEDQILVLGDLGPGIGIRLWIVRPPNTREVRVEPDHKRLEQVILHEFRLLGIDSESRRVVLIDARDGSVIAERALAREGGVLRMSHYGQYVYIVSKREVQVFRVPDLRPMATVPTPGVPAKVLVASRDEDIFAVNTDREARIWNRRGPRSVSLVNANDRTQTIILGNRVVTWSEYGEARLWCLQGDPQMREIPWDDANGEHPLTILEAPSQNRIAILGSRGTLKIWRRDQQILEYEGALSSRWLGSVKLHQEPHIQGNRPIWFLGHKRSRDRSSVLAWNEDSLRVWRIRDQVPSTTGMEQRGIQGANFSADNSMIISWDDDRTARLWSTESGSELMLPRKYDFDIREASITENRTLILVWGWAVPVGSLLPKGINFSVSSIAPEPLSRYRWKHSIDFRFDSSWRPQGAAVAPSGSFVVAWGYKGLRIWNLEVEEVLTRDAIEREGVIRDVSFSEDGRLMLTTGFKTLQLWETDSWRTVGPLIEAQTLIRESRLSPDQKTILATLTSGAIRLWKVEDGDAVGFEIPHETGARAEFSSNGRKVLSWQRPGLLRLFRTEDGFPVIPDSHHLRSRAMLSQDARTMLSWNSGGLRLRDISADFDFPAEHLPLLVEATTGTTTDILGFPELLPKEQWETRRNRYLEIARNHARECRFPHVNLYLRHSGQVP